MRAVKGCDRKVKKFVSMLVERRRARPPSRGFYWPRQKFRRPAPGLPGTDILTALARAWSVTSISVVMLSVAVCLAPMWDRATFVKSLIEALNSDPEMLQLAVTDAAADQVSGAESSVSHTERPGQ